VMLPKAMISLPIIGAHRAESTNSTISDLGSVATPNDTITGARLWRIQWMVL